MNKELEQYLDETSQRKNKKVEVEELRNQIIKRINSCSNEKIIKLHSLLFPTTLKVHNTHKKQSVLINLENIQKYINAHHADLNKYYLGTPFKWHGKSFDLTNNLNQLIQKAVYLPLRKANQLSIDNPRTLEHLRYRPIIKKELSQYFQLKD